MKELIKKVCIFGDPAVGKTSLIRRFVIGKFEDKYLSTLGTVITKKSVVTTDREHNIRMIIWDISGQSEFRRVHRAGFKNAAGGFAVYDITRPETAENLNSWINNFKAAAGEDVPIIILANKFDLVRQTSPGTPSINDLIKLYNLPVIITSAKTNHNIEFVFRSLADGLQLCTPDEKRLYEEMIEMPEMFENPSELLDYISIKFCEAVGDTEMGMHMLRKQVADEEIDFTDMSLEETMLMIDRLVKVVDGLHGDHAAKEFRRELIRAHSRCREPKGEGMFGLQNNRLM